MNELARIERKIAAVERYEKPVSAGVGITFAVIYLWWQYTFNHWIATYTWMIPFAIGYAVPTFLCSIRAARLDREKRAIEDPTSLRELPEARIVKHEKPMPVVVVAPRRRPELPPADVNEGPRMLK
ncbi:MAG: hypothetical protein JWO36_2680 [Myxococcales bacterium]|nr:hypothetical protein [Myxococcales bacterium]